MSKPNRTWLRASVVAATAVVGVGAMVGATSAGAALRTHDVTTDSVVVAPRAAAISPALGALNESFAATAARVKPSVVYITARQAAPTLARTQRQQMPPMSQMPEEFRRFFQMPGLSPDGDGAPEAPHGGTASGSGFVVTTDGYILTNAHVVDGADRVTVRLLDRRQFPAKVVGADRNTDVAVLKIDAPDLTPAPLGSSDAIRVGEWVLAVGNPLGEDLTFTVTSGIISAKGRSLSLPGTSANTIQDYLQTDAAINPGNSGGPLVNVQGEVIGINSAIASPTGSYAGYGFAVPIDLARQVMQQLIDHGRVQRAALGVAVRDAGENDADYVGLHEIRGVLVQDVTDGSPAKAAGVQPGDVIVALDGQPVDYVGQLQERVAFRQPGETVSVEVARKGGERKTLRVRLQGTAAGESTDAHRSRDDAADDATASGRGVSTLGVQVAPLDDGTARQLQLPSDARGVLVMGIDEDGPAAGRLAPAGMGGPDLIVSVEGTAVHTPADLRQALAKAGSGSVVTLRVYNAPSRTSRIERVKLR